MCEEVCDVIKNRDSMDAIITTILLEYQKSFSPSFILQFDVVSILHDGSHDWSHDSSHDRSHDYCMYMDEGGAGIQDFIFCFYTNFPCMAAILLNSMKGIDVRHFLHVHFIANSRIEHTCKVYTSPSIPRSVVMICYCILSFVQ